MALEAIYGSSAKTLKLIDLAQLLRLRATLNTVPLFSLRA